MHFWRAVSTLDANAVRAQNLSSQQAHLKNVEQTKVLSGSFSFKKSQWQMTKHAASWIQGLRLT